MALTPTAPAYTAAGFGFSPNAEAVARVPRALAFRHDALPLAVVDGVLAVALPDPDDAAVVDALRAATRLKVRPLPMPREAIREKLRVAYGELPAGGAHDASGDAGGAGRGPGVRRAVAAHASDVHVEPAAAGSGRVRLRVDGILRELETIPAEVFPSFVSRLKLLAGMDIANRRQPQDGRCSVPFERPRDRRARRVGADHRRREGRGPAARPLRDHAGLGELGMAPELFERYRAAARAVGLRRRDRPDRERQDDDALRVAGATRRAGAQRVLGRGPGRDALARRRAGAGQPARRANLSDRAARVHAPGPRRGDGRRDARRRDRHGRRLRGAHRPDRLHHPARQRRAAHRRPADRAGRRRATRWPRD